MKTQLIIFGVNYFPAKGGTSTVVENLILQLKHEYEITIHCYGNEFAKNHIDGVKVIQYKQWLPGSAGSLLYFLQSALVILFSGKADLIHAHKTDCAVFIPLLRLRFKVIATSHEAPYKRDKWNRFQRLYFHLAEKIFIRSANLCTCISEPLAKYYESKYRKKIYFVPNGINKLDMEYLDIPGAKKFIPEGGSIDLPYILFAARRLMSTKGCHTMLAALQKIAYKGQVFIAAELPRTTYLNQLQSLSEGLNVFFLGYVNPLSSLLALSRHAQLFIFPSETEGMSVMLLEAASTGVPIVASNIPENLQVFSDKHVLFFQSGSENDLAEKISYALSNPHYLDGLSIAAQRHLNRQFLWPGIAKMYTKLYNKLSKNQEVSHINTNLE